MVDTGNSLTFIRNKLSLYAERYWYDYVFYNSTAHFATNVAFVLATEEVNTMLTICYI